MIGDVLPAPFGDSRVEVEAFDHVRFPPVDDYGPGVGIPAGADGVRRLDQDPVAGDPDGLPAQVVERKLLMGPL